MSGKYKSFSLKYLCEVSNISSTKIYSTSLVFGEDCYKASSIHRKYMIIYNIEDCVANIELCKILYLINQVIYISYCSNSCIWDVLLYNKGDMETSCICRNAYNLGYQFVWTRCDAKPESFKGGELLYYGPRVRDNVMAI